MCQPVKSLPQQTHDVLPRVWAFAYRVLRDERSAETAVCLATERSYAQWHLRPDNLPLFHWLISNICQVWKDKQFRTVGPESPDWRDQLTRDERVIWILLWQEQIEVAEVALILDMQTSEVIRRCSRVLRVLKSSPRTVPIRTFATPRE